MAVLNKDQFFQKLNDYIGDSNSDEDISFFEDMTDTYSSLEKAKNGDGVNWEQKCKDVDAAWRKKYRNMFFRGDPTLNSSVDEYGQSEKDEVTPENITFDDLFKKEG